jgi:hypothetical protein
MRLHAFFVDTEERKCGILSGDGAEGAHATDTICGSRWWNCWRMRESGFVVICKSYCIDLWSLKGSRSLCSWNPFWALQIVVVMMKTKLGAAGVQGHKRPRPPASRLSWLIRMA